MKHLATLVISASISSLSFAQPQLLNAGFETWGGLGTGTEEPDEWSSIKTSDGGTVVNNFAPQVCWRSDDGHTGSFSLNVRTVTSLIGAANGIVTCGRVHAELDPANGRVFTEATDPQWNQLLTSRPDSLVGWYKTTVMPGDHPTVDAIVHTGAGSIPENGTIGNWVGAASWDAPSATVGEWTRFSVPFNYFSAGAPEYLLMVMTSGDSLISQIGTQSWYDDIALIYNVACTPSTGVVVVSELVAGDFDVSYSTGGIPEGPTTFTVELSDVNGDFTSPVTIGSVVSASATGIIPCSITAGTLAGAGYAIRIITDSPFYAPVGCAVQIELETGIAHGSRPASSIRWTANGLLIDSKDAGRYECFDVQGRAVANGSLLQGVNTVALDTRGMILVRVMSGAGSWMERVVVN